MGNTVIANIKNNEISAGTAGNGAASGDGGNGGDYGSGGLGSDGANWGGNGGNGGDGGRGGSGGGGPSIGIYVTENVSPVIIDNVITSGRGGQGGHYSYFVIDDTDGDGGDSYAIFDVNPDDGSNPVESGNTLTPGFAGNSSGGIYGTSAEKNF